MKSLPRSILFCLSLSGFSSLVTAQTATMNYIQSFDVQIPGITDPSILTINTPDTIALQTIQYFDGLGRQVQTVQKGISPRGFDMIKPVKYNDVGLDTTNFEPYVDSTHAAEYRTGFVTDQPGFYSTLFGDGNGMSPITYEKSPLNRVMKQGAPGTSWQTGTGNHPIQFSYLSNNTTDLKAVLWKATGNTCSLAGNYGISQLYVTKTLAEDSAVTFEFKDKQGKVILKRSVLNATTNADTYYVYDDYDLLRFVISPEGSAQITTSFDTTNILAKRYVYAYNYDGRRRLVAKRIPGKEPEYYVYDKTDKVILYQDGNMRKYSGSTKVYEWMFTKYDALGRVIMTGITTQFPDMTCANLQTLANGSTYKCWEFISYSGTTRPGDKNYYSNQAFPAYSSANCTMLTLNYYDRYTVYLSGSTTPVSIVSTSAAGFSLPQASYPLYQPELQYVTGKPTANFVRYDTYMLQSATYYDVYGRVIQTSAQNQLGSVGYDRFTNLYKALTSNILKTEHTHFSWLQVPYPTLNETTEYTYDATGRPLTYAYTYNGAGPVRKINYSYTTLGQVKSKQIKDDANLMQTVDYVYNIRGWLTKINNPANVTATGDLFGMELRYNNTDKDLSSIPAYNGNISAIIWQTAQPTGVTTPITKGQKAYTYTYDNLNRLLNGNYFESGKDDFQESIKYKESILNFNSGKSYDLNGNILGIIRNGLLALTNASGIIDKLTYTYDGNKLIAVDDVVTDNNIGDFWDDSHKYTTTPEYAYDANGNLTKDINRSIPSITYNYLNLPTSITKTGGDRVEYSYDASGTKRQQRYYLNGTLTKTTDFFTNFVYENSVPAWVTYDEGRVVLNSNGTANINEAYIKDHLGNVRVVYYLQAGSLKTQQVNSYYPFGKNIKGLTANGSATYKPNEYLYNGKMMQDEMGLGWLDYGARFYDPVLGRWHSPDPLEQYESGYVYGGNNPISMNDPSGMWADDFNHYIEKSVVNNAGQIIFNDPKSKDKNIYLSPDGRKGSDGNTSGLEVVGTEQPNYDYSKGKYIISGTNLPVNYRMPQSGNIDIDLTIEELFFGGAVSYKAIKFIARRIARITVKELLDETIQGSKPKQRIRTGDLKTAKKDFKNLQPENVKPIQTKFGPGETGTLPNGQKVTVRPGSSEGSPTLEIWNSLNTRKTEIRYKW